MGNKSQKILLNKKLSQQFAGWYYCNPCHNENYKVPDNFYGPKNFKTFTSWIHNNEIDLSREIIYLKKWINSKSFSYHSWKIEKNNWLQNKLFFKTIPMYWISKTNIFCNNFSYYVIIKFWW